ncbi:MAG TPA: hypothetical protein VMB20_02470 [Candidatus Acidoferrum sp.]|nr:hypothetical protein [Candidatus Acidoferrum sp.]
MNARFGFVGAVILAAALAACGGGGGGGGSTPPVSPTPTPCASPAGGGVGFCGTTATATIPQAAGASAYVATMNFSAGSGTATISASTTAPTGAATLNALHMHAATAVHVQDSAPYTTIAYITLTATSAVSLSSVPTITVTSPSGASGAYYNAQGFWVTLPQSGSFTLANGSSAYFAIYTGGTLPSPNPEGCVGVQSDASTRTGAHAALVGVQPIMTGAAFNYTGTLTETIARATPCAMPTATQQASVTVAVSVTSSPAGSTDEHSVETDNYSTNTTTTTTDAIVAATTVNGASGFSESTETSTDDVGDQTITTYATPLVYAISSPLPYSGTITNGPPSTVKGNLADGTTTNRTYNADGSYTETDTIEGGYQNTITVNADFSGSYVINSASYGQLSFTYTAPASGSVTITETGPTPGTYTVPQWWTGSSLYSDTMVDKGTGGLPSTCSPTPAVSSADDFRRTISIVDPVLGYTETETIDAYVSESPTVGPACVVIADTEKIYYDYFFDTPFFYYPSFAGSPLQTDTISEAYWYASAPTGDSSVRLAADIAAHASGIAFARATQRARRIENFVRGLAAAHVGGVK